MSEITVYSPNKSYTGMTASIEFAGGRSHPFEEKGNEGLVKWFEKRGFGINKPIGAEDNVVAPVAMKQSSSLPPVEEDEGEDEDADYNSGIDDTVDADSDNGAIEPTPKRTSKSRTKKSKK